MKKYDYDYLLLFSLPSCPQCKGLAQSLAKTGLEYEKSEEYEKYGVTEVPTLILMESKKGHRHEEAKRHTGFMTEDELNEFVKGTSCTRWIVKDKKVVE
jgi:glutaredoxin